MTQQKRPRKTSVPLYSQDPHSADKLILDKLWVIRCALADMQGAVTQSALNQSFRAVATMIWEFREHTKFGEGRLRSKAAVGKPIEELALDHVFPVSEVAKELFHSDMTREHFEEFMRTRMIACLITRDEHKQLEQLGFKQSMPADWDRESVFYRYEKAGIELDRSGRADEVG